MNRWIPITKENPKGKEQQYIVTIKDKHGNFISAVAWWDLNNWNIINSDGWIEKLHGVIAWMKMPEPYQIQKRNDK